MRVTVDTERCVGSGQCALNAPDMFDQRDEDGVAVVLLAEPPADTHTALRTAAALCPASAIRLTDPLDPVEEQGI
ncbi:ferredoxin (plasmid) [Streptomyces decoyicus]|nr:ferredoxin [Streptomyces decoyicus]